MLFPDSLLPCFSLFPRFSRIPVFFFVVLFNPLYPCFSLVLHFPAFAASLLSLCSSLPLPPTTMVTVCWEVPRDRFQKIYFRWPSLVLPWEIIVHSEVPPVRFQKIEFSCSHRCLHVIHGMSDPMSRAPKVTPNVKEHSGSCLPQFPARGNQLHTQQCELP